MIYVAVTLLVAIGAINSQNNLLFAALGVAIGGLLVSGIISGSALMGIQLERIPEDDACVGRPVALRYRLRNANRLIPAFGLHIEEVPASGLNWTGFFRAVRAFVTHIRPRGSVVGECVVVPIRRGKARFHRVKVWSKFPFGLTRKSITFAVPHTLLVHPAQLPLRPGVIRRMTARAPHGIGGERSSGLGDEFFALREYIPGDNPRHIAWKRSARTDTLIVRQQAAPAPTRLWIVVRFPVVPGPGQAFLDELAIALAAAMLRQATADGIATGIAIPLTQTVHPPRQGRSHIDRVHGDLAMLDLESARSAGADERLPETAARSGACIIIHAGPPSTGFGPRYAMHIEAARAREYFTSSPDVERVLTLMEGGSA